MVYEMWKALCFELSPFLTLEEATYFFSTSHKMQSVFDEEPLTEFFTTCRQSYELGQQLC